MIPEGFPHVAFGESVCRASRAPARFVVRTCHCSIRLTRHAMFNVRLKAANDNDAEGPRRWFDSRPLLWALVAFLVSIPAGMLLFGGLEKLIVR